jgi:hypothetical protein
MAASAPSDCNNSAMGNPVSANGTAQPDDNRSLNAISTLYQVERAATDHLFRDGRLLLWGVPATGVLVETLLDRCADGDVAEAEAAIERLAAAPADDRIGYS